MIRKFFLITVILLIVLQKADTQTIDSICFHLYTDSLKKGTHNYINVDGRLSNGKWIPLTEKEILFTSSYGKFEGNDLVLPAECPVEMVRVKAVLRRQPLKTIERTIWIKKLPDPDILPTRNDLPKKKRGKRSVLNEEFPFY